MAGELTVTAAKVAPDYPTSPRTIIRSHIANSALTAGLPVYVVTASGKVDIADGNGSGTKQVIGITLCAAAAGAVVRVLEQGELNGFDLSSVAWDAPIYLSDTAGSLATSAGSVTVIVGRVRPITTVGTISKTLLIRCAVTTLWA